MCGIALIPRGVLRAQLVVVGTTLRAPGTKGFVQVQSVFLYTLPGLPRSLLWQEEQPGHQPCPNSGARLVVTFTLLLLLLRCLRDKAL